MSDATRGAAGVLPMSRRGAVARLGAVASVAFGGAAAGSTPVAEPLRTTRTAPPASGAGAYPFRVGAWPAWALSDGAQPGEGPPAATFAPAAPRAAVDAVLRDQFLPADRFDLQCTYLLVRTPRDLVLVDTGSGPGLSPALGRLPASLALAGFAPGDVTAVVVTHAHPDHLWGVADGPLGAGARTFPNARYYLPAVEWDLWTAAGDPLARFAGDAATKRQMLAGARRCLALLDGRVTLFRPDAALLPGVTTVAAPGHTPGHCAVLVDEGRAQLLYSTDAAHHTLLLARPDWQPVFDFEPERASASRRRLLDRAAADRVLVMGSHFPWPSLGHVRARSERGTAFEWVPAAWRWT